MTQDRRYARGAEDMQEFIARELETQARFEPEHADVLRRLADHFRLLLPAAVRSHLAQDDKWMRRVAEREIERVRAGWRVRTAAYQDRQKRKAAGENVPPVPRGPKRKSTP